jgi:electron transport complex protein RnfG
VADRFKIKDGDTERTVFVGVLNGKANTVVLESTASGYGDKIGLVVGSTWMSKPLRGIAVTTHKETPGLGANAKANPAFAAQFGQALPPFQVTNDGGEISALSGATITSRAVCSGVNHGCH